MQGKDDTMDRQSDVFILDRNLDWQDLGNGVRRKLLGYNGTVMMARIEFQAGAVGTEHRHPHIQCSMVESGVFDITISGRTERLRTGDGYLVPANELHSAVAVEAGVLLDTFTPMRDDFLA
jgi:quercetin dioxygenase-like cupin family protein